MLTRCRDSDRACMPPSQISSQIWPDFSSSISNPFQFFSIENEGGEEDNQRVRRFNGRSIDGNAQFLPRYFQREGEGAANISIGPSIIVLWNSPYSFEADLPSLNLNSITPDLYSLFPMNIQTVRGERKSPPPAHSPLLPSACTLFPPSIEYPKN